MLLVNILFLMQSDRLVGRKQQLRGENTYVVKVQC